MNAFAGAETVVIAVQDACNASTSTRREYRALHVTKKKHTFITTTVEHNYYCSTVPGFIR
jgi:hypothetical protein